MIYDNKSINSNTIQLTHYNSYLAKSNIPHQENRYHLSTQNLRKTNVWQLYISLSPYDLIKNQDKIFPAIASMSLPFKVIKNSHLHQLLNDGDLGHENMGKAIIVFFETVDLIDKYIPKIKDLTEPLWGPKVKGSIKISSCLYGSSEISSKQFETISTNIRAEDPNKTQLPIDGNPFIRHIRQYPINTARINTIIQKYKLTQLIKSEPECKYYLAMYKDQDNLTKNCIIKCGYKGTSMDAEGRDITDQIRWQQRSFELFSLNSSLPSTILEDFPDKSFLIMESPNVTTMEKIVTNLLNGNSWRDIQPKIKLTLLHYWKNIVQLVDQFHRKKLTINNISIFDIYIGKDNNVTLLDWSKIYSHTNSYPNPPFRKDRPGFSLPSKTQNSLPEYTDDIFSLGALFLSSCTPIPVYRLYDSNQDNFKQKLSFFLSDPILEELVLNCLSKNSADRPTLSDILNRLSIIEQQAYAKGNKISKRPPLIDKIELTLKQGIKGLANNILLLDELWFSDVPSNPSHEIYEGNTKMVCHGLYKGVEGILYFLCAALNTGWDVSDLSATIKKSIELIDHIHPFELSAIGSSLYYGTSGIALLLKELISLGIISNGHVYEETIKQYFSKETLQKNILHGVAGETLALIQCEAFITPQDHHKILTEKIDYLISTQNKDGSWDLPITDSKKSVDSFGYGMAGILYSLLELGHRYELNNCIIASESGISYLSKNLFPKGINNAEYANIYLSQYGFGWCDGLSGKALMYLKAYKITGLKDYLVIAEFLLRSINPKIVSKNLGQCHGLAGLGEVYLEIHEITQSKEWWDRATSIAWILCTLTTFNQDNSVYWLSENSSRPTAGFMTGNTGIMHFLIRYLTPQDIGLPFMPI